MGLTQSFEGLKEKIDITLGEGILPPDSLRTRAATSALPWVSSLQGCPADFGFAGFHHQVNQFLKMNLERWIDTYIRIHPIDTVSLENPNSSMISGLEHLTVRARPSFPLA